MARTITVTGMSCGGCEEAVEDAVSGVPGVTSVAADNEGDSVAIEGDADPDAIHEAIEEAGYDVAD